MKHSHYYKDVTHLEKVDVYRIIDLFQVTDPCIQHAIKKLLVAGGRGAGKDVSKDIQEAIDSLVRWQEMKKEDRLPPATLLGMPYTRVPNNYVPSPMQCLCSTKEDLHRALGAKHRHIHVTQALWEEIKREAESLYSNS